MRRYFLVEPSLKAQKTQSSEGIAPYKSDDGAEQGKPVRLLAHKYSNGSTVTFSDDGDESLSEDYNYSNELLDSGDENVEVSGLEWSQSTLSLSLSLSNLKVDASDDENTNKKVGTPPNIKLSFDTLVQHNEQYQQEIPGIQQPLLSPANVGSVNEHSGSSDGSESHHTVNTVGSIDTLGTVSPRHPNLQIEIPPQNDDFNVNDVVPQGMLAPRAGGRMIRFPFGLSTAAPQAGRRRDHNNRRPEYRNPNNLRVDVNTSMSMSQGPGAPRASRGGFRFGNDNTTEASPTMSSSLSSLEQRFKYK